ncbi:MAG: SAM-dependent methyltransferase [Clostridiales bacterium]|nr:SAM-dependent methyltransferase [Clostridiales bacterium]
MTPDLSVRLESVAGFISPGAKRVIDVGSDHGLLGIALLKRSVAEKVVCTDINKGPADRSRLALNMAGFKSCSEVFNTDGLKGVSLMPEDYVVIAGMGGLNIIDILKQAKEDNPDEVFKSVTFVLQPQKSLDLVRLYLSENGFEIVDERACTDKGFHYQVMKVIYSGKPYELSLREQFYGPVLIRRFEEGDEEVEGLFEHLTKIYKVRARGDERIARCLEEDHES